MEFLSGLAMGFLGSMHCAGMCGPLALALPVGTSGGWRFVAGRLLFNGGRIVTYMMLGALVGSFGGILAFAGMQQAFSIALGLLLLVTVFLPSLLRGLSARWSVARQFTGTVRALFSRLLQQRALSTLFLLGIVNGLLPCGFLYIALAAAATLADPLRGTLFLAGFGTGTIPLMLGISLGGKTLRTGLRRKVQFLLPVLTVFLAILFILRGLNLGIPMVSPKVHPPHGAAGALLLPRR